MGDNAYVILSKASYRIMYRIYNDLSVSFLFSRFIEASRF
jgi:hypothetical protein